MKVRDFITKLLRYNMDAEVKLDLKSNWYELEDFEFGYGGPDCGEGLEPEDTPFVIIQPLGRSKELEA